VTNTKDKLYRSQTYKILGGVCGGIGQHYSLDPLIIRILWVVAVFTPARGLALLGYILCWLLIPREPSGWRVEADFTPGSSQRGVFLGIALVIIGIMALLATTIAVGWPVLFAIAMIIIGALIALGAFPNGFSHHKEG
jgi:phage shock protein C